MQKIEISGVKFDCFNKWERITLSRFVDLCLIQVPEKLTNLWKAQPESDEWGVAIEAINESDSFVEYYKSVILCLTDITPAILDLVGENEVNEIYYKLLHPIALSAVLNTPFDFKDGILSGYETNEKSFKLNDEEYFYPSCSYVAGVDIPMSSEEIISFIEAGDIVKDWKNMAQVGHKNIALLAGIYCRKDGEVFNQDIAIARAAMFENLTMDIYWNLFFCILKQVTKFQNATQLFMERAEAKRKEAQTLLVN